MTFACAAGLLYPALSAAHLERPSYWPDPRPDTSVSPPAGGEVPQRRSLRTAVTGAGPGDVRVVCQGRGGRSSLRALRGSVRRARAQGHGIRPSQPKQALSRARARSLLILNQRFAQRCRFNSIQSAVNASGNNDRVVIMPGYYTEPASRRQPTNDPRCANLTQLDQGGARTPSFRYQVTCPNDQNLIYVQGRAVPDEPPPSPPLASRQGIPDEGPCLRCNLQIEGSGVTAHDVVVDAGEGGSLRDPLAKPTAYVKDVVVRADRADGFVTAKFTVRGAREHGLYIEETDGSLMDHFGLYWNRDYGNLTFTSDHGLYRNCDGFGSGDAVIYPGAAPETGEQTDTSFWPDAPRTNTVVTQCDLHGSALAYSGSMGNGVRITRNHIYGNATGITTDTISAPGHPGFPQDSLEVDNNLIYSNNLNIFGDDTQVEPIIGVPIGVGLFIAGGNASRVHDNYIFDNWRRGTMLIAIPDAVAGEPDGRVNEGISCQNPQVQTSCDNRYFDNVMGRPPPGFVAHDGIGMLGNVFDTGKAQLPNGVDFWWDEFPGNTGNCWTSNEGPDGDRASLVTDPPLAPAPGVSLPQRLPENCGASVGTGSVLKEAVLADCGGLIAGGRGEGTGLCDWFVPPNRPQTPGARRARRAFDQLATEFQASAEGRRLAERFHRHPAFADRPVETFGVDRP